MKRKMITAALTASVIMFGCGFGSGNTYGDYEEAYMALMAPGSLNTDITLILNMEEETVRAEGNMKMDQSGAMYFELEMGDKKVTQYAKDGKLYSDVDGAKEVYDTSEKNAQKPVPKDGDARKEEGSGFSTTEFMEEFASMLEAGKIREMGLLDPIPEQMIDEITAKEEENGIIYTLDLPDSFMEKIFNIMIREQVSEEEYAVSFSNLKEFRCYMHENADGILDGMRYEGNTDVTIPEALTGEAEKTENLSLELQLDVVDPGSEVTIPEMDLSGFEE